MPKEVLEEIFVQRERLAERTVRQVRESILTGPPSHTLFVGPRGIGKTHLVSLIYHRLKALPELKERLAVAWLPEDEGSVASFLDLLVAILHAMSADDSSLAVWLRPRLDALYDSRDTEAEAKALLIEAIGERSLLLLAENLDDIFAGLRDAGQKALRAFLQETRLVTLVVTAQSLFDGVSRHTSPFYGFFRVEHLSNLNLTEAVDLLIKIAEHDEKPDLVDFLKSPAGRARVRAVDHLVAGNPRLYVIFSEFLTRESLDELVPPFLDMLDGLTPYYQAKMRSLSPQQRKIVDFLSGIRGALPVKEIARRSLIGATTAAAQLKLLRESGYVRIAYSQGRETYYELKEPLMRLCLDVKKQRGEPIKLFVEFLRLWCPAEELERRLAALSDGSSFTRASLREALRLSASEVNPLFAACRADYMQFIKQGDQEKAKQVLEELQAIGGPNAPALLMQSLSIEANKSEHWMDTAKKLFDQGLFEKVLAILEKVLAIEPENTTVWANKGLALMQVGRFEEALLSYEKILVLDAENANAWNNKGTVLSTLERYDESLAAYEQSLVLDAGNAAVWHNKGELLGTLGRFEDALVAFEQSLALDAENAVAWYNKGAALGNLGRLDKSLAALEQSLALDGDDRFAWNGKGMTLGNLGRSEEALVAFEKSLNIDAGDAAAWNGKGAALANLGRIEEALAMFDQSLILKADDDIAWNNKGIALYNLGRFEESLAVFNRAIQMQPNQPELHIDLVKTLFALNRWKEGFAALRDALPLFIDASEDLANSTEHFIKQMLNSSLQEWSLRTEVAIDIYETHNQTLVLGFALVGSIPSLDSTLFSPDARRLWYETWQTQAGGRSEFVLPLRLLDVAVRYLNSGDTPDARILLELAAEERSLLKPLLGIKDAEEDED